MERQPSAWAQSQGAGPLGGCRGSWEASEQRWGGYCRGGGWALCKAHSHIQSVCKKRKASKDGTCHKGRLHKRDGRRKKKGEAQKVEGKDVGAGVEQMAVDSQRTEHPGLPAWLQGGKGGAGSA